MVYFIEEGSEEYNIGIKNNEPLENSTTLKEYLMDNFTEEERKNIISPKYFYNITFEKKIK